jgi:hypothetical protein
VNVIADTWRQLVRRRLWPLAVLLLAALVAVPVLLAKDPAPVEPPAPQPVAKTTAAEEAATGEPVVALAEDGERSRRRRVLGARKDPFEPAPTPEPKQDENQQQPEQTPEGSKPTEPSGGGSDAPVSPTVPAPAPVTPTVPAPTPEPPKKKTYPQDSLIVGFGDPTSDSLPRMTLEKLEALPDDTTDAESEPVLVYMGLTKDDKHAIFMIGAGAEATGDGECKPHPSSCETVHLRKGETEFFDVKDDAGEVVAQYELDLVDIKHRDKK